MREKELLAQTTGDLAKRDQDLAAVYASLSAIESDRAPAIASSILAGLGFSPSDMNRYIFSSNLRSFSALVTSLDCNAFHSALHL